MTLDCYKAGNVSHALYSPWVVHVQGLNVPILANDGVAAITNFESTARLLVAAEDMKNALETVLSAYKTVTWRHEQDAVRNAVIALAQAALDEAAVKE